MKKISLCIVFAFIAIFLRTQFSYADTVILPNGTTVKGKINYILSGMVEIKTLLGVNRITREVPPAKARDIVEIGFIWKKKYTGEVLYYDNYILELVTPSGNTTFKRYWVRNITLNQQN